MVQVALADLHKVVIPHHAIETLLRRCILRRYLTRQYGRYSRTDTFPTLPNLTAEKQRIAESQAKLASAFVRFAKERNIDIAEKWALELISAFLNEQQIAVLLQETPSLDDSSHMNHHEQTLVAEFLTAIVQYSPELSAVLRGMLEGLVLYHAAFIPDLELTSRKFKNLTVYFDSNVVRQALGYEGEAKQTVLRETVKLLKQAGIRCLVFDKTVREIERLLEFYEHRLATTQGRIQLRQSDMTRYFLTEQYGPGDIRELLALLEINIQAEGFRIVSTPRRQARYVSAEAALQKRLVNPITKDENTQRIAHDVDCVAGILTLRKGHASSSVENCRYIFASSSPGVIREIRQWYADDERGSGIPPIISIQMLSNLAWLKSPKALSDLKQRELMALCTSAMRPSEVTWQRFLRHLTKQQKEQAITSDEMAAILVDSLSEDLLMRAENDAPDGDVDAETIDDVIYRVRKAYMERYEAELASKDQVLRSESKRAESAEQRTRDLLADMEGRVTRRAHRWARAIRIFAYGALALAVLGGGLFLWFDSRLPDGALRKVAAAILAILFIVDFDTRLRCVHGWLCSLEKWLIARFESFFRGPSS